MDERKTNARYAAPIADEITSITDDERCLPSSVRTLFAELDKSLCFAEDDEDD